MSQVATYAQSWKELLPMPQLLLLVAQQCDGLDCTFTLGNTNTYRTSGVVFVCWLPQPAMLFVTMAPNGATVVNATVANSQVVTSKTFCNLT